MSKKNFNRIMRGLEEAADFVAGKADEKAFRVHVPEIVDVKAIRKSLALTQQEFAASYGFTVGAVRDWEQGRRQPEASARILLKVIEKRPEVIAEVLGAAA
ncbi:MAG TPA: NadS family protein [Amphiplicatus sp.]|nr:type II toxin-antitoxin system MqsA family antitoxin [Amphiplicatus sp.]HOP19010.1 NadS family protein [Amphiplicatus sp.]HRX39000.1 NadS family protein [Parvularculaceae bacterium]